MAFLEIYILLFGSCVLYATIADYDEANVLG